MLLSPEGKEIHGTGEGILAVKVGQCSYPEQGVSLRLSWFPGHKGGRFGHKGGSRLRIQGATGKGMVFKAQGTTYRLSSSVNGSRELCLCACVPSSLDGVDVEFDCSPTNNRPCQRQR